MFPVRADHAQGKCAPCAVRRSNELLGGAMEQDDDFGMQRLIERLKTQPKTSGFDRWYGMSSCPGRRAVELQRSTAIAA